MWAICFKRSGRKDLNLHLLRKCELVGPIDARCRAALRPEYQQVPPPRLELGTSNLRGWHSNQLSYEGKEHASEGTRTLNLALKKAVVSLRKTQALPIELRRRMSERALSRYFE